MTKINKGNEPIKFEISTTYSNKGKVLSRVERHMVGTLEFSKLKKNSLIMKLSQYFQNQGY